MVRLDLELFENFVSYFINVVDDISLTYAGMRWERSEAVKEHVTFNEPTSRDRACRQRRLPHRPRAQIPELGALRRCRGSCLSTLLTISNAADGLMEAASGFPL